MPQFIKNNRRFYTPVEYVFSKIGGTYKMPILWRLKDKSWRFSELNESISRVSDRMLSKSLKELVKDGFVDKEIVAEVPTRVQYTLTDKGKSAIPLIENLRDYGFKLMEVDGIKTPNENS